MNFYDITASYKEDGQYIRGVPVIVTITDGGGYIVGDESVKSSNSATFKTRPAGVDRYAVFVSYFPLTSGKKTLTFTANDVTKTETFTVK